MVAHVSVADQFCPDLRQKAFSVLEKTQHTIHQGGNFITIEGPRFSTKAESLVYRNWGMAIIGMTASPEIFLAREAGLCYVTLAHVTDYDVWHESEAPVTVEMVIKTLMANVDVAQGAIQALVPLLMHSHSACDCEKALSSALITAPDKGNQETRKRLQLLTE